jgi:hypothetical protein
LATLIPFATDTSTAVSTVYTLSFGVLIGYTVIVKLFLSAGAGMSFV